MLIYHFGKFENNYINIKKGNSNYVYDRFNKVRYYRYH